MTSRRHDASGGTLLGRIAVAALGVLAVIGLLAGALGLWTMRTLADSERFEARTEELLSDVEISDALARRIVAEVDDALGLRDAVVDTLPDVLVPAADVLLAGVRTRLETGLGEVLRSDRVVAVVGEAAGRSHAAVVAVVAGDEVVPGVEVDDGRVRLDLFPVVVELIDLAQGTGLFADVDLDGFDPAANPADQRAWLADELGRPVPDDFARIVVFELDALASAGSAVETARDLLTLARRIVWLFLLLGTVLAGATIWSSAQRWRAATLLVAGIFAGVLVVVVAAGRVRDALPDTVEDPGAKTTIEEFAAGIERSLTTWFTAFALLSLAMLVAAIWGSRRLPARVGDRP